MSEEREALTELIAEAHASIKDLRATIRDAHMAVDEIHGAVRSQVQRDFAVVVSEAVHTDLNDYHDSIKKAIDESVVEIYERFDKLMATLLGETRRSIRQGNQVENSVAQVRAIMEQRGWEP